MYKLINDELILRESDHALIPFDPDNVDYQAFEEWRANGGEPTPWSPESLHVPVSVTPLQARLALLSTGKLSAVESAVAAADQQTKIAWQYASSIERNSQFVASLAAAIGLSEGQTDDLFRLAVTFNA